MKVKVKGYPKPIDVSCKDCPNKSCFWPRSDPGTFVQGRGYRFRSNDWLCGTREIHGCPQEEIDKENKG